MLNWLYGIEAIHYLSLLMLIPVQIWKRQTPQINFQLYRHPYLHLWEAESVLQTPKLLKRTRLHTSLIVLYSFMR